MSTEGFAPILIDGKWRPATAVGSFVGENPVTREPSPTQYPISDWADINAALTAAVSAFEVMQELPRKQIAAFLRSYAEALESKTDHIATAAAEETGYAFSPRLREIEMPRTVGQLKKAAAAAEDVSWRLPTIDAELKIYSVLEAIGPTVVFGPNNFPLAFNGISGGDFAAALAAGNPVIAKAHPSHPATCRLLAECAQKAASQANMPEGTVQMLYKFRPEDGLRLVQDPRLGAVAFTGSRSAGMKLKAAADAVGKPIYLEMSSINPIVILPGALEERSGEIANEIASSVLLGTGQFCTKPGLILALKGELTESLIKNVREKFADAPCGTLLDRRTQDHLVGSINVLVRAGATVVYGNEAPKVHRGNAWANTLLRATGEQFLRSPQELMTEAFGNSTLVLVADDLQQLYRLLSHCEGNLTGCVYSARDGRDDVAYDRVAKLLRPRVGRLLNDKVPTGVAVSPGMNHGGPFPATGHPHFTSVGLPAAMRRFTRLACYDNVRPNRLPSILRELVS